MNAVLEISTVTLKLSKKSNQIHSAELSALVCTTDLSTAPFFRKQLMLPPGAITGQEIWKTGIIKNNCSLTNIAGRYANEDHLTPIPFPLQKINPDHHE